MDGLVIGSGCTVRGGGDLTVIHTPVTTGNAGYSITSSRISGTSNNDVRGCNFVNWGWHAGVYPNFAHSGTLSVKDCVAHGIGATGQPFVAAFGDTNSDVTYTVDQNAYIPTPRIKPDGTVIDNSTDVAMYTSHDMAGSGVVTERRRRSLQLDFVQQQGVGTGVAVAGKYEDCWFVGEGAKASGNGTDVFTRCKLDRSGRGDTSSNATVLSTGNRTVRYIDSEVWTGDILESYLLSIGSGDVVELNNTIVHVGDAGTGGNTEVFRIATGTADSLEIGSSTFINEATVDGLVGAASAGIWNANFTGVSSDGANVFYGFAGSVTHSNGAVNPATRQWDWWVNNIAGASTDTAPGTEPTIDTTRPTVSSVALVEGNVVVTYSESISAVNDAATIAADIERATGTIASASINGAELTLTPDGSNPFTSETLLVPAAVVKNAAGNSNPAAILSTGLPDDYFIIRNADGTTLAVVDAATTEILISALGLGIGRHRVYVARVSGSCESDAVELTIELISVSNAATARIEPSNVTAELQADGTIQLQWMSLDSTRLLQVPAVFEVANVDDLATVLVTTGGGVGLRRATVPGYSDEELVQLAVRWSDGMIGGERGSWVYGPLLKADAAGPAPPTLYGGSSGGC
ncbi:MAG: Ig-like domain-containing protein [Planctomycetota bacterium]